jgi:hypothetical protein
MKVATEAFSCPCDVGRCDLGSTTGKAVSTLFIAVSTRIYCAISRLQHARELCEPSFSRHVARHNSSCSGVTWRRCPKTMSHVLTGPRPRRRARIPAQRHSPGCTFLCVSPISSTKPLIPQKTDRQAPGVLYTAPINDRNHNGSQFRPVSRHTGIVTRALPTASPFAKDIH